MSAFLLRLGILSSSG